MFAWSLERSVANRRAGADHHHPSGATETAHFKPCPVPEQTA
jgi:hypothetical protein